MECECSVNVSGQVEEQLSFIVIIPVAGTFTFQELPAAPSEIYRGTLLTAEPRVLERFVRKCTL